jgi:dihydrofolate reductase
MAELLVDFITSLDGYGAAEGWPGFWGLEGPEYFAWLEQVPDRAHTILMGATTYRLMSSFAAGDVETREVEDESVDELTATPKIVFSSTLDEPLTWANARLVRTDPVAEVRALKEAGTSLRTLGSLTLCRSLLTAGLVDRFRVVVFPVVTGATGADRIYDGWPDVALEMIGNQTFDGRLQLLEYVPTVLSGPPGAAPQG